MVQSLINCSRYNAYRSSILRSILFQCYACSTKNSDDKKSKRNIGSDEQNLVLPEPPTTCCMSGCANCVWIQYAEKLTKIFNDGGVKAREKILETVTDGNMRAFLLLELRTMKYK